MANRDAFEYDRRAVGVAGEGVTCGGIQADEERDGRHGKADRCEQPLQDLATMPPKCGDEPLRGLEADGLTDAPPSSSSRAVNPISNRIPRYANHQAARPIALYSSIKTGGRKASSHATRPRIRRR